MHFIPLATLCPDLAFSIMGTARELVRDHVPELKQDFPAFAQCDFKVGHNTAIAIATISFKETGISAGGQMDVSVFEDLRALVGSNRSYVQLKAIPGLEQHFAWDRIIVVADLTDEGADWAPVSKYIIDWINDLPLPRAQKINLKRVQTAIPSPPQYDIRAVMEALWVLECEEAMVQGTAFDLAQYGTVTNYHVVAGTKNLLAFRAAAPAKKYPVRIVKSNAVLDLALLEIAGAPVQSVLLPHNPQMSLMQHAAVCGFPNYRLGDTGVISPGLIVGTRNVSSVRRLLTNAGIVRGMSGGPAVTINTQVCGICVTGADWAQETRETEDQSIIPIAALDVLVAS